MVNLSSVKSIEERAFASISIPSVDRFVTYFDFRHDHKFNAEIGEIFVAAHEETKAVLRRRRYSKNRRIDQYSDD